MSDLISREAAIDALENSRFLGAPYVNTGILIAKRLIKELPTAEPKKGKWLTSDDMYETGICSCCGYDTQEPISYVITNFKHCPNCGAKMEGEKEG